MEVSIKDYYGWIKRENIQKNDLPVPLQIGWEYINKVTQDGQSSHLYDSSKKVKSSVDLFLEKFSKYYDNLKTKSRSNEKNEISGVSKTRMKKDSEATAKKFINSFLNLHGKEKTGRQVRLLIGRLQKAIEKKEITKDSTYARYIMLIQRKLIDFYGSFSSEQEIQKVELTKKTRDRFSALLNKKTVALSGTKPVQTIPTALDIEKMTSSIEKAKTPRENGHFLMSSQDLLKTDFKHLDFTGKWLALIGNPERGFRMAIFGAPKMGKSYLMISFAGYLAENHGKVLYVAKEEGKSATLQKKLSDTVTSHPRLMVSNYIPANLREYDFCFLDSVTRLGLSPKDLVAINTKFPNTSIIEIHQVTKDGKARGVNDFIHDVDAIVEVPEKGRAIQYGRFNQGGEMRFF